MENQEEKKACCEGKESCNHEHLNCCGHFKNCRMMKLILGIIILVIVFCVGAQWGEMRSEIRGDRFERGNMMNWKIDRFDKRTGPNQNEIIELPAEVTNTVQ